jgi:RNA polymerase-binding protein DksA
VAKSTKKAAGKTPGKPASKAKAARPRAAMKSAKATSKPVAKSTTKSKTVARATPVVKTTTLKPIPPKKAAPAPTAKLGSLTSNNNVERPATAKPSNGKSLKSTPAVSTIIPPPPPPRTKPSKNQAGLSMKELETFRDLLLAKRRELVGDMYSMEREALQRSGENLSNLPLHMADMGTDNYEQEFTLGLMEKDRQLLREINQALSKIMDGRYGICEGTGKVIAKARLEVQPWAKYSIEHARKLENRGVR